MAKNRKNIRRRGRFCVAGGPNQQNCKNTTFTPGVTMHQFPANPVLREKWIKFVQRHRHDFHEPSNMLHFALHTLRIRAAQGL